ncbi:ABC transporter substrate-binding protein [Paenibacillus xylaniclasticus]|uniref:ABC transporter substrate-binding protein n=1 Tax=Paenibacillus xylaniclasticus TaxID=588083 RepID=UPI000FDB701F|nr:MULTISPECIES: extracellular solute-binding protein [Paenibacillus]GFN31064.1 sugar ABC transporter substrate-binding protein [Paenibacillus curdlanolyticus]
MKIKWKRSLAVMMTVALSVTLAACGGSKDKETDTASADSSSSDGKVKLRIMWWGSQPRHEATLKALELYTKNNPNVTFEPEYSGMDGYLDKLSTQAAAKNAPDIYQLDPGWVSDWQKRGQLAELTGVDVSKVDPKVLSIGQFDGKNYAVPLGSVAYGMIYDKASLEKAGATAPQNGWTWDDFFALADSLKGKLPQGQYFTKDYAGDYFAYSAYQYAAGKGTVVTDDGKFNIDHDTFVAWTTKFEQLRKDGLVPPADLNASDKEFDPTADLMVAGKILFRLSFSNNYASWDSLNPGAYALVTMPRAAEAGGWLKPSMFFGISPNSKNAEEAQKFVNWFLNDSEVAQILGTHRGMPVNTDIAASIVDSLSDADKIGLELLNATLPDGQTYTTGAPGWTNFIDKDFALVRDELSFGRVTPEEAFNKLKSAAEEYENQ